VVCLRDSFSPWAIIATLRSTAVLGFVPRENIIGKPLIIYWSYDAPTEALAILHSITHIVDW